MKIRTGFVSNSSSSSFIVIFPHDPTSAADVMEMMFGAEDMTRYDLSPDRIAQRVWQDIEWNRNDPDNAETMREQAFSGNCGVDDSDILFEMLGPEPDRNDPRWSEWKRCRHDPWSMYVGSVIRAVLGRRDENTSAEKQQERFDTEMSMYNAYHDKVKARLEAEIAERKYYVFEYGDENGDGALEHSDIFSHLPHWQISHH
ncbi:MAG: hypothetical protein WC505_05715 [Patescibacteria group bacterium]